MAKFLLDSVCPAYLLARHAALLLLTVALAVYRGIFCFKADVSLSVPRVTTRIILLVWGVLPLVKIAWTTALVLLVKEASFYKDPFASQTAAVALRQSIAHSAPTAVAPVSVAFLLILQLAPLAFQDSIFLETNASLTALAVTMRTPLVRNV
jgi:hypothetical protein